MRAFEARYKELGSIVICANSDAARRVSALDFAALYGACETNEIAIVDLEFAARAGAHWYPVAYDGGVSNERAFIDVTEELVGVVDIKKALAEHFRPLPGSPSYVVPSEDRRRAERRARADAVMDRRESGKVYHYADKLCVCAAGPGDHCTCKSFERATYQAKREGWWQEMGQ